MFGLSRLVGDHTPCFLRMETVQLQDEWICLVCDIRVPCEEQMQSHLAGKRHATNHAYFMAKGCESWFGDPYSSRNNFWTAVKGLIPEYENLFDRPVSEQEASYHSFPSEMRTMRTKSPVLKTEVYRKTLPVGIYFCELCENFSTSRAGFIVHLSSHDHEESLSSFKAMQADYFQAVIDPATGHAFYIGLITGSLVTLNSSEFPNEKILALQWRVAGKHPRIHGTIMQAKPEDMLSFFR